MCCFGSHLSFKSWLQSAVDTHLTIQFGTNEWNLWKISPTFAFIYDKEDKKVVSDLKLRNSDAVTLNSEQLLDIFRRPLIKGGLSQRRIRITNFIGPEFSGAWIMPRIPIHPPVNSNTFRQLFFRARKFKNFSNTVFTSLFCINLFFPGNLAPAS